MPDFLRHQQIKVRQGAHLPHWTLDGAIYHVVFRPGDSLPVDVVAQYRTVRDNLRVQATRQGLSAQELETLQRALFSEKMEALLDQGMGACWLAREQIASLMIDALRHFSGTRYDLHAWCVMPNHVHVVVQPRQGYELSAILKSWKGFSAREANRHLSREGEFWQPEYYDPLIRNEPELSAVLRYVQANPRQAGLKNWRWVWPPG